jgi:hypothetical protein
MATTYTLISSSTPSNTPSSVAFSSIPQTYTDLVLRGSIKDTSDFQTVINYSLRFNGINTGYSHTNLRALLSAVYSARDSGTSYGEGLGPILSKDANSFTSFELYLPNYTNSLAKPFKYSSVSYNTSNFSGVAIHESANLLTMASAVSSMTIYTTQGFTTGSSFYLYGIKNS